MVVIPESIISRSSSSDCCSISSTGSIVILVRVMVVLEVRLIEARNGSY